jgi:hypothetical protein
LEQKQKGQVTLSNKLTRVFSFACYTNQFFTMKADPFRKILKEAKEVVFV